MLFSHDALRPNQKELAQTIQKALREKHHVLANAPTGLGKTAAALCPALEYAKEKKLSIFFLTSRHTQHKVVLETIKQVNERNGTSFRCVSLIGKKSMCGQDIGQLPSSDFSEFCKSLVENDQCDFYTNARGKNNVKGKHLLAQLRADKLVSAEQVLTRSTSERVCPYEMSLMLAETADVIVADYYYLFHPNIRDTTLPKLKKKLEECIIIVDEAHNLPSRLRDVMTSRLTTRTMRFAIQEAKKHDPQALSVLVELQEILLRLGEVAKERKVTRELFVSAIEKFKPYDEVVEILDSAADMVREAQRASNIGGIVSFMKSWVQDSTGFARILRREELHSQLTNRCLDPSLLTKDVFDACYCAIMMSGTLEPLEMYTHVLGVKNAVTCSFESPFPQKNRLSIVVPKTSTKYSERSEQQFRNIAQVCAQLVNAIPGRVMMFFPSYAVRDAVAPFFADKCERDLLFERTKLSKQEKQSLLDRFAKSNGVLLGVAAGSFGEGVDLPGLVKGVIVVGLPLEKPDLETSELIDYYDKKFGKGWEYGYILPAMAKCIQNAGRCIRTETDRGVIAFVDERYAWPRYKDCFPKEWQTRIESEPTANIAQFFGRLM